MNFKMSASLLVKPVLGSSALSSPHLTGQLGLDLFCGHTDGASLCSAVWGEQE